MTRRPRAPAATVWRPATAGALRAAPQAARAWICLPTSVTRRIGEVTGQPIRVTVLHDGRGPLAADERAALGLRRADGHVREVVLEAGGHAVLAARSVWATAHRGGRRLRALGDRPLGALLFAAGEPHWRWREFAHLALGQDGCDRLTAGLRAGRGMRAAGGSRPWQQSHAVNGLPYAGCWARRTLYVLDGSPLLVLEAFLPALLAATIEAAPPR